MKFYSLLAGLFLLSACNNTSKDSSPSEENIQPLSGIAAPQNIGFNITGIFPHDTSAYTQGLEIHNGKMYESTGDYVNSSIRVGSIKNGKPDHKHLMGTNEIFGEGITIFNNKIYQLTWKNNVVNVYDVKNIDQPVKTFSWPYEGWGITHNTTDLIISDGSANLYFVNPEDFKVKSTKTGNG